MSHNNRPSLSAYVCFLLAPFLALMTNHLPTALAQSSQTASQTQAPTPPPTRSVGPANIAVAQSRLSSVILQLQHDRNTYDGHRDKAVQLIIQAQQELNAAAAAAGSQPK